MNMPVQLVGFWWHGWFSWKDDASVNAIWEMRPNKFYSWLPAAISYQLLVAKADRMVAIFESFITGAIMVCFNYKPYFFCNEKVKSKVVKDVLDYPDLLVGALTGLLFERVKRL